MVEQSGILNRRRKNCQSPQFLLEKICPETLQSVMRLRKIKHKILLFDSQTIQHIG